MDWNKIERIIDEVRRHEISTGTAVSVIIAEYQKIH